MKTLSLHRETLRSLDDRSLQAIRGGGNAEANPGPVPSVAQSRRTNVESVCYCGSTTLV